MTTTAERTTATSDAAPARKKKSKKFSPWSVVAWLVGIGFFFPVFWMLLTSFKQVLKDYDPATFKRVGDKLKI